LGDRDWEDHNLRPVWAKSYQDPISTNGLVLAHSYTGIINRGSWYKPAWARAQDHIQKLTKEKRLVEWLK
jgi:hypothetical protein